MSEARDIFERFKVALLETQSDFVEAGELMTAAIFGEIAEDMQDALAAPAPDAVPELPEWFRSDERLPPDGMAVLTWHEDDLHPVAAARICSCRGEPDYWARQIEGPEDSAHSPGWNEPLYRVPTYWARLPEKPARRRAEG